MQATFNICITTWIGVMHPLVLRILLISSFFLITACDLSLTQKELAGQALTIKIFDGGLEVKRHIAEVDTPLHQQVSEFILSKKRNWKPNFVSYAQGVMIYGDGFNINLLGDKAIYNGAVGQLTRKIQPEEYLFIIAL